MLGAPAHVTFAPARPSTSESGHLPQVDSFPKYIRALLDFIAGG